MPDVLALMPLLKCLFLFGYTEVRENIWLGGQIALIDYTGGYALGSASDQLYTPDGLLSQAKMNGQPALFVGVNYRLGSMALFLLS